MENRRERTNKNRKMENKRWKECEWDELDVKKNRERASVEKQRKKEEKISKSINILQRISVSVKIQLHKHHMALSTDHFHDFKWSKPKFKVHSAISDPSQANVRRRETGSILVRRLWIHARRGVLKTNALYTTNKDYIWDTKTTYASLQLWQ